jgi:hypothetical protein
MTRLGFQFSSSTPAFPKNSRLINRGCSPALPDIALTLSVVNSIMTVFRVLLIAVSLVALPHHSVAFVRPAAFRPSRVSMMMGVLDQLPGESDSAFMKRLMNIASDAATFEKAVMESNTTEEAKHEHHGRFQPGNHPFEEAPKTKLKGAYQRVEDWDRERKENISWEERVQFDGQRYGNQVNQDDILRHHLHTF